MVLKRPFVCDIEGDSAVHGHWSGVMGDRTWSQYDTFIQTVVLETELIEPIQYFYLELVLESSFISYTGEVSLLMSPRRQSFELMQKFYFKDGLERAILLWDSSLIWYSYSWEMFFKR